MSVELANSFWPRKLSAAPIGFSFQCKTLFEAQVEHLILWLEVVDEEEAVGLPSRLLVDPVQLVLRRQGAQLFDDDVQLVLVAQPPAAEKLHVHPHGCADEPQFLGAHPGADLHVSEGAVGLVQLRAICVVVQDNQHLVEFLHLQLLRCLGDLALPLDDPPQRCLVPLVVVGLFPLGINPQVLLYVLLYRDPAVVDIDGRAKYVDFLKDAAVLLRKQILASSTCWGTSGQSCVWRRNGWSNPVASAGLRLQSCAQRRIARPAPGTHQARTRQLKAWSGADPGGIEPETFLGTALRQAYDYWQDQPGFANPSKPRSRPRFSKPFAHFSAPKRAVTKR